jgi:hypothetical protein
MLVPKHFWEDAAVMATYIVNKAPSRVHNNYPLKILKPLEPLFVPTTVFGYVCYVHQLGPSTPKLSTQFVRCVFLRYSSTQKDTYGIALGIGRDTLQEMFHSLRMNRSS